MPIISTSGGSDDDHDFWKRQNLWVGVVAPITTGVFVGGVVALSAGQTVEAISLLGAGVVGSAFTGWLIVKEDSQARGRLAFGVAVVLAILTWAFIGCDIYHRRQNPAGELARAISTSPVKKTTVIGFENSLGGTDERPLYYSFSDLGWPVHSLKEIRGKTYHDVTLPLDGYVYIDCSFDHVQFYYEGTDLTGGWVDARKIENGPSILTRRTCERFKPSMHH